MASHSSVRLPLARPLLAGDRLSPFGNWSCVCEPRAFSLESGPLYRRPTLNSVVCIAQVPDTETRIKIGGDGRRIDEAGAKFIVSPYDEYALEEALPLKEKEGGDVTVLGFGPDRVQQSLRESLARGATKALHVKGDFADADSLGSAKVLSAAIKTWPHDLAFFGKQGVATDNSLVGPMRAERLGYPPSNMQ